MHTNYLTEFFFFFLIHTDCFECEQTTSYLKLVHSMESGHIFGLFPPWGSQFLCCCLSSQPSSSCINLCPSLFSSYFTSPPTTASSSVHHILLIPPFHLSHLLFPLRSCLYLFFSCSPLSSLARNTKPGNYKK